MAPRVCPPQFGNKLHVACRMLLATKLGRALKLVASNPTKFISFKELGDKLRNTLTFVNVPIYFDFRTFYFNSQIILYPQNRNF